MKQLLDEKKYVIMPLLDHLRQYNNRIGSYDRSVLISNFNYSVKLSNGKIEIVEELVADYERTPNHITVERFKAAANEFIPNSTSSSDRSVENELALNQPVTKRRRNARLSWIVVVGLVITAAIIIISTQGSSNFDNGKSLYSEPTREKTPEEIKQELLEKEQQNPTEYLKHQGKWRNNLIGQTVLTGTISNSATFAGFKDVVLDVVWLTKTGTELKAEQYPIYEFVDAGKTVSYKIKVNAPSATGGVRIGINSATPVN